MTIPLKIADDYKPYSGNCKLWPEARQGETKEAFTRRTPKQRGPYIHRKYARDGTLQQFALEVGRPKYYFSAVDRDSPHMYRYMRMHGKGNMADGYRHYCRFIEKLYSDISLIAKAVDRRWEEKLYPVVKAAGLNFQTERHRLMRTKENGYSLRYPSAVSANRLLKAWRRYA